MKALKKYCKDPEISFHLFLDKLEKSVKKSASDLGRDAVSVIKKSITIKELEEKADDIKWRLLRKIFLGRKLDMITGDLPIEHETYGTYYPLDSERLSRLREALQIIISMWTEERSKFKGKFYKIKEPPCWPKPIQKPHSPIWIDSGKSHIVKIAAKFADNFNILGGSPEPYREK